MKKATLRQYLAEAEDHIDDARRRVERQTALLEELTTDGRDTAMAKRFWSNSRGPFKRCRPIGS
jgi:hypothetical protein